MQQQHEDIKTQLNRQTAKISWLELQKFYAAGNVVAVKPGTDLLQVAEALHNDHVMQFQQWLADGLVYKVNDQQAQQWFDNKDTHWAVVVAPFVLVQIIAE